MHGENATYYFRLVAAMFCRLSEVSFEMLEWSWMISLVHDCSCPYSSIVVGSVREYLVVCVVLSFSLY
jgi:hypothetical protein